MRSIFVNLPVKDLEASKRFFLGLGMSFNAQFTNDEAASLVIAENIFAMLVTEARFRDFITGEISDARKATEVLLALSCDSREEVDDLLSKAMAGGASAWKPMQELGFMYGASFQDLDGHVWELVWMDPAAVMPT